MPPPFGNGGSRTRKWVSKVTLFVMLCVTIERTEAISYRKDSGFATDGMDQFVFRESPGSSTGSSSGGSTVKRAGRVRFVDGPAGDSFQQGSSGVPTYNRGTVESVGGGGFFQGGSSSNRDRERDQFYTVGASIQLAGGSGDMITPPPPVESQPKPKRKKNKYKYSNANEKIYTPDDQGSFTPYAGFGGVAQRYPAPLQDNYLTPGGRPVGGQYENSISNYPELQKQQYPFSVNSPYPGVNNYYYGGQQQAVPGPVAPNNPYQYQYPAQYTPQYATQPYAQNNPGFYQQPQQSFGAAPGGQQPPNAQSILGVLQSIFNFAPGTFGSNSPAATPTRPGGLYSPAPTSPFVGGVGGQLRQALDNISENDELQCVPKLVCMMSRSSTGQGFSLVNRGLLSTILGAVPDSSPWLKFSRAALLGYGIGANSCDAYYPKCPKDEMEILYYLNNHRGGFFRFFSNGDQGQTQQQQQYG
ncbi:AGAP006362-PA-like protein [Anopheles sinensis]|uniref:AGAP006362-PA-like protein n=1 Tax=Anopheles sinensis TaxID=74873 RepID=A0A084WEJ5_ANOSI|nr:AGAP006362-PA-like protein [Anopheles sinensis]